LVERRHDLFRYAQRDDIVRLHLHLGTKLRRDRFDTEVGLGATSPR
jgi:hypothetical protein